MSSNDGSGDSPEKNEKKQDQAAAGEAGQPDEDLEGARANEEAENGGSSDARAALQEPEMCWLVGQLVQHIHTTYGGPIEDVNGLREELALEILRELIPRLTAPLDWTPPVEVLLGFYNDRIRIGRPFSSFSKDIEPLLKGKIESNYKKLGPWRNRPKGLIYNGLGMHLNNLLAEMAENPLVDLQGNCGDCLKMTDIPMEEMQGGDGDLAEIAAKLAEEWQGGFAGDEVSALVETILLSTFRILNF